MVNPDRFTSCAQTMWELYTYTTTASGIVKITGSINFWNFQWNSYDVVSLTWTHVIEVYVGGAYGTFVDGVSAWFASVCDIGSNDECGVTGYLGPSDDQEVTLTPGTVFRTGWLETDTTSVASSPGVVSAHSRLGVKIEGRDAQGIPTWNFLDADLTGRCDSVVNRPDQKNTGCVNPAFTPTVTLSIAKGGASAAMVKWAQQNLSGHWGLRGQGPPMHKLTDAVLPDDNREVICGNRVFQQDPALNRALQPYGDRDSCDEFPFANTYESGAMVDGADGVQKPYVTTGADCAQVTAVQAATTNDPAHLARDWPAVAVSGTPTGTEPCVRGHIPGKLNFQVGGVFGRAVQDNRLVDKDPFWVEVTP